MRTAVLVRNGRIVQSFCKELSSKGLSPKMVEQHGGTIENFAQTSLLEHDPPRGLLDIRLSDVQSYLLTHENKTVTTSFKRFIRFLEETERMDYEHAEALRAWLKQTSTEPHTYW